MAVQARDIINKIGSESSDFGMIAMVIGTILAMVLPMPAFLLDFLLALNITLAIIVLITTMYTETTLEFSIFPSLLLVLTLFRLSLNVASTRLILLHGSEGDMAAGSVIKSFGSFVVGGNYVVGMVIFIVLVLINFMVITKGSGRIAEVAARFTLDGMPGKQMAIDADLNAGIIDEVEAKERREEISRESEFHGAMDGASKFVRGDAVAGIIITGINIIGGFVIGVLQQGMDVSQALSNYTLLTVGDGLVTQIPALIISTASGILVSRAGSKDRMGKEFVSHIFMNPTPIYIGSGVVFLMGFVPGLPLIPFATLGILIAFFTFYLKKKTPEDVEDIIPEGEAEEGETGGPEDVEHLLSLDVMELEVGYGLIPLVDQQQDGMLLGRIRSIRRQFVIDMGIIIPPIHIRDNLKLKPAEYRMMIRGVEKARCELMVNHLLAMDPGDVAQPIDGIPTTEPAFQLPALWIPADKEEDAKFAGYTVVDNSTVIATHITEIIRASASDLLGRQEVQGLLDNLSKTSPKVVEELIPNLLTLGLVQKVLQNLLRERVSIRDLLTIVETLADYAAMSKDPDLLAEYVRQKLAMTILDPVLMEGKTIQVITLDPACETMLGNSVKHTEHGSYMSLDPQVSDKFLASAKIELEKQISLGLPPVTLASPVLRRHVKKLVDQINQGVTVLSHAEILHNINIQSTGKVVV